jgi:hypothetical protein
MYTVFCTTNLSPPAHYTLSCISPPAHYTVGCTPPPLFADPPPSFVPGPLPPPPILQRPPVKGTHTAVAEGEAAMLCAQSCPSWIGSSWPTQNRRAPAKGFGGSFCLLDNAYPYAILSTCARRSAEGFSSRYPSSPCRCPSARQGPLLRSVFHAIPVCTVVRVYAPAAYTKTRSTYGDSEYRTHCGASPPVPGE